MKLYVAIGTILLGGFFASARAGMAQTTATSQVSIASSLSNATGVAVDPFGDVYAVDGAANSLLQIAGANSAAVTLTPNLLGPGQVAVDTGRNVYVANGTGNAVLKFTYASGSLNLNTPASIGSGLGTVTGVAVDLSGNVYIVDAGNKRAVKVSGSTQTVIASNLSAPSQIAVDIAGNVYIADPGANTVVYLPTGGAAASTVGSGLSHPGGVAVDVNNNVYIADTGNNAIKEVPFVSGAPSTSGQLTLASQVTAPASIAVDYRGSLYVASQSTIQHFSNGAIYFGLLPIGQKSAVLPVTITFASPLAAASVKVVTTGLTGLDFNDAGGGTCSATSYAAGNTCSVNVTFQPRFAGVRAGAIVFYDSNNKILSRTFIGGGGNGPVLTFDPGSTVSFNPGAGSTTAPATTPPVTLNQPHGTRFDAAGNLFVADTNNLQVVKFPADKSAPVVIPVAFQLNDIALNGAGDLVYPNSTVAVVVPYENGTWNTADAFTLGTGFSKARTVAVDIAGTIFVASAGNNNVFRIPFALSGTTEKQINAGLTTSPTGVAVDLYGNVGIADNSATAGVYIPVSGATPYKISSGMKNPWGIAFDAAGSAILSDNTGTALYRIPNENGVLTTADQQTLTGTKYYSLSIDPYGNIFSTLTAATTNPSINILVRSVNPIVPSPFIQTINLGNVSVGSSGTANPYVLGNAGNAVPVYSDPKGYVLLGDIDDLNLSATVATPPTSPLCNFTTSLLPGYTCYLGIAFTPQSSGTRTVTLSVPSQSPTTPAILFTGGSGTAPTGDAQLALARSSPAGSPLPGQAITITATTASAATGSVTFSVDGLALKSVELSSGSAVFTITAGLSAGTHSVSATYSGNKTYGASATAVSLTVTVVLATPTLTINTSGTQVNVGQAVTLTGAVQQQSGIAVPTGTLTFFEGASQLGMATLNSSGIGAFTISTLALGTHTISYKYSGDAVYATGASGTVTVTVGNYIADSTTLSISPVQPSGGYVYGTAISAAAIVAPQSGSQTPTGSVVFSLDGVVQPIALSGNKATLNLSTVNAGTHVLSASYGGDTSFASSASNVIVFIIVKDTTVTALKSSSLAFDAGSNVTLTATVTAPLATPTGQVQFKNGVSVLGTVTLTNGTASLTTATLPAGTDTVTAGYLGDTNDSSSVSSPVTIAVSINTTAVTLGSSTLIVYSGMNPTFTATVSSNANAAVILPPTGLVTFTINGTTIATAQLGTVGTASYTPPTQTVNGVSVTSLPSGVNTVVANYAGDANYSASTTATAFRVYVAPATGWDGDYSIAITPNPVTVTIGTTSIATVTATPIGGYFGFVQISCTGLPNYANCDLQPDQITLDGTGKPVSTQLSIVSKSPTQTGSISPAHSAITLCGLGGGLAFFLWGFGARRRARSYLTRHGLGLLALLLMAVGVCSMTACGGHPPLQTAAGTYTVSITATGSGNISHSTVVQMTFKQ